MTPELWQRLKPLYNAALDLPEAERLHFVQQTCGSDPECAAELGDLLAAEEGSDHSFASPLASMPLLLSLRPAILSEGTLLAGRFRIVRHIGSGGMGDVYEALDEQMEGGRIALKTIRPSIAANAAALARFKDEVRLARKVSGPNVCRIHELYLTSPDHDIHCTAFLTMELLEGVTLHDRIAEGSPLPPCDIEALFEQLCTGIDCIHQAGIVHGDLKPRNVMLVPGGEAERVVVTDFGLARAAAHAAPDAQTSLTGPVLVAGTPSYMAPEQFEGREVGPATDVYALGLILDEMATGLQPFAAHTPLAAAIRRSKAPTHASLVRAELPPVWDDVITRCLQYDPADRYPSTDAVLTAFQHPGKIVFRLGKLRRLTIPKTAIFALAALIVLCVGTALWFAFGRPRHPELPPDAARFYSMGMTALREGSYLKATRLLATVTQRDPKYALAHAALADAWTELDFTASAQREMLLAAAPEEQRGLNDMERRYIDAVRTTLTRDYSAAAQDYEAILKQLPDENKAQGYVDLGRIYEKAGRVQETVASYEKAAKLNPDDPAPFLHLGILRSRLRDRVGAASAFDHAETLYTAESDPEGLAEVAYQRGFAADQAGQFREAEEQLKKSLELARQIANQQMEVRSRSQLSSVEDNKSQEGEALVLANQALDMARAAGLEYWTTDSLIRVGNAYMGKEDFAAAEPPLEEALHRAEQSGHPRLEAFAKLNLASLYDQQGRASEQIQAAMGALGYYQDYGFLASADQALILLIRGERATADYEKALQLSNQLIQKATQSDNKQLIAMGEELTGEILADTEQYPNALDHFERALQVTQTTGQGAAYQELHCAEVLWPLGRYEEARKILATLPSEAHERADLGFSADAINAGMQQSQRHWQPVLVIADEAKRLYPDTLFQGSSVQRLQAFAYLEVGKQELARRIAEQFVIAAQAHGDYRALAQAKVLRATMDVRGNDRADAQHEAESAQVFFERKAMYESEALTLCLEARLAAKAGEAAKAVTLSEKSLDIFRQLEQSWGTFTFNSYSSRPDIQHAIQELRALQAAHGER